VLTNDGGGGFGLSSSPTVGLYPVSVTAADVNGDGHVDLISANYDSDTLSVLTNDGSGNFGLLTSPAAENGPYFVTVADINEDGRPDLITANYDTNTLSVLTNDGGGGFGLSSSPTVGLYPVSVTAADVNGDGHVDLISANFGTNTLSVLTNNGSGSFVLSSSPGVGPNPVSVAAADLNGDGRLDLIGADQSSASLSVLTNDGSGGFGLSSSPGVGFSPTDVKAADLNGDGHLDLVTANQGASSLSVLTNDGTGGFVLSSSPPVGGSPVSVTAADVNGDGRLDLISANRFNLSVLFNTPTFNGSFRGDGSGLTSLNASQLNSGTVADARLSANVSLLGASIDSSEITDGTIVNADINAAAGIVDTKLATISTAGKVADSALSANVTKLGSTIESSEITDGTIVDADINAAAAIADTKLATIATAGKVADSALSANVTKLGSSIESSEITDGTIVDADINAAAAIGDTKLATISTAGKVADTALSANVALRSGGNAFTGLQTVTGGNVGIGTNNPGLNNLQINPTFHYANGYGLVVNKTDFGANIQVNRTAGQVGIGLVVDDSSAGDGSTALLEVRNNVATSPQTLLNVAANGDTFVNGSLNLNTGTYPGVTAFIRARPGDSLPLAVQGTNGVNFFLVNTNGRVDISGDCYAQSFTPLSDRNAKDNFAPVSPTEVLAKVAALPIQEWNFKTDAGTTHIGPMAQDFYAAFGVGPDDKHIATVDADGVALAAIQGLNQKLTKELHRRDAENAALRQELQEIKQLLSELTKK
jgi:hypothetical protein